MCVNMTSVKKRFYYYYIDNVMPTETFRSQRHKKVKRTQIADELFECV